MAYSNPLQNVLSANAQWAADVAKQEPQFFTESAKGQTPHTLWIGCADSRVPESVVTGSKPGDIFVHRNIANQLHPDDPSVLSVLSYAVEHLNVQHVIIVGHTNCGGAAACLGAAQSPTLNLNGPIVTVPGHPADDPLNRWLEPLTRLTVSLGLSSTPAAEALPIIVDENVKKQVENLANTRVIKETWAKGGKVEIHGWVYDLSTGRLKDLNISRSSK